jgi:SpoVK/Ycf46/Vps4 family AAA+-type ATPase
VSRFTEVKRHKPSVIFIPSVDIWWNSITDAAITTFTTLLRSIPPSDPVLLLATAECTPELLAPEILKELFGFSKRNRAVVERPEPVCSTLLWMQYQQLTCDRKTVSNSLRISLAT